MAVACAALADNAYARPNAPNHTQATFPGASSELDAVVALINARGFACSGVIVAPTFVLTARHCLPIAVVTIGDHASAPQQRIRVARYRTLGTRIDVALLELEAPAAARPIPFETSVRAFPRSVTVAGYGESGPGLSATAGVRHTWSTVLERWGCTGRAGTLADCSPQVELVIPRGSGFDTCFGDSGGPVLEQSAQGLRVIAITSRAVRNALLPCGDGGVYVRVDVLASWIRAQIKPSQMSHHE